MDANHALFARHKCHCCTSLVTYPTVGTQKFNSSPIRVQSMLHSPSSAQAALAFVPRNEIPSSFRDFPSLSVTFGSKPVPSPNVIGRKPAEGTPRESRHTRISTYVFRRRCPYLPAICYVSGKCTDSARVESKNACIIHSIQSPPASAASFRRQLPPPASAASFRR